MAVIHDSKVRSGSLGRGAMDEIESVADLINNLDDTALVAGIKSETAQTSGRLNSLVMSDLLTDFNSHEVSRVRAPLSPVKTARVCRSDGDASQRTTSESADSTPRSLTWPVRTWQMVRIPGLVQSLVSGAGRVVLCCLSKRPRLSALTLNSRVCEGR